MRALAVGLLCFALAACASPTAIASPTAAVTPSVVPPTAASQSPDWAALERRLHLPVLTADGSCPRSSGHSVSAAYGDGFGPGPVYPVGLALDGTLPVSATAGGYRQKVLWVASAAYQGPVLIRGRRLDGSGVVSFAFGGLGSAATPEARLVQASTSSVGEENGWREWPSYTQVAAPGCYAYQVDGTTFSIVIGFQAVGGP